MMGKLRTGGLLILLLTQPVPAQEVDPDASGFDVLRIEQENKLLVPPGRSEEVWNFLRRTYIEDAAHLRRLDPSFTSRWYLEEFWDTYFDTPSFDLLASHSGVRHRRRVNHTAPDDVKSGRELVQIKINGLSDNPLDRGEIKFDVSAPGGSDREDHHPLIGLVRRSQRDVFKARLSSLDLDPHALKPILTVHDMRRRIYIEQDGRPFLSISFDQVDAGIWWAKTRFVEIEPELNEIAYTEADPARRAFMEQIRGRIVAEILAELPYVHQDLSPKYNKSLEAMRAQLPFLPMLLDLDLHTPNGMIGVLCALLALASLLVYAVLWRTRRRRRTLRV